MKVILTDTARADLRDIVRFIEEDNAVLAVGFARELRGCCDELRDRATLYPFADGLEQLEIRRRLHRGYLILYRIEPRRIAVLHVVHGARDYLSLFKAD